MKTKNPPVSNLESQLSSLTFTRKAVRDSIHVCYAEGASCEFLNKLDEALAAIDNRIAVLNKTISIISR